MEYLKAEKGRDRGEPVVVKEGERLEKPKLMTQKAPTSGKRRRIVGDETIYEALEERKEAML